MVFRVAGRVNCADGSAFHSEDLAVRDGFLAFVRCVFENGAGEVGVEAKKVRNAASVITVPVGEENVG